MQSNPDGNWLFYYWMLKCIELEAKISLVNLPVSLILQAVHGMFPTVHSRHQPNPITPVFTPGHKVCMYLEGAEVGQEAVTHAVRFRDKFPQGKRPQESRCRITKSLDRTNRLIVPAEYVFTSVHTGALCHTCSILDTPISNLEPVLFLWSILGEIVKELLESLQRLHRLTT